MLLQSEMAKFNDLEYCKTDLIAAKGIVFCKYGRTSSALRALEAVQENGMVLPTTSFPSTLPDLQTYTPLSAHDGSLPSHFVCFSSLVSVRI